MPSDLCAVARDDLKEIASSCLKIIEGVRDVHRMERDVSVEAATILKLLEPHLHNTAIVPD